MREKSPAFQFYPKDWLTDDKVVAMTDEERGIYINLLCLDWLNDGLDPEHHVALKGGSSLVRECFKPHRTKVRYLTNMRLQKEREKQAKWREKSSHGGKQSGKSRKNKVLYNEPNANQMRTKCEPNGNSSSSSSSSSSDLNTIPKGMVYTPPPRESKKFDIAGKEKYLDWVYLSRGQYLSVKTYYESKGLTFEDFEEAVRELDRWFSDNPKMRDKRTDDSKTLKGWPLDRALERRQRLNRLQMQEKKR